jgi:hypothetical protein
MEPKNKMEVRNKWKNIDGKKPSPDDLKQMILIVNITTIRKYLHYPGSKNCLKSPFLVRILTIHFQIYYVVF